VVLMLTVVVVVLFAALVGLMVVSIALSRGLALGAEARELRYWATIRPSKRRK
jgi:hypothetical protein